MYATLRKKFQWWQVSCISNRLSFKFYIKNSRHWIRSVTQTVLLEIVLWLSAPMYTEHNVDAELGYDLPNAKNKKQIITKQNKKYWRIIDFEWRYIKNVWQSGQIGYVWMSVRLHTCVRPYMKVLANIFYFLFSMWHACIQLGTPLKC